MRCIRRKFREPKRFGFYGLQEIQRFWGSAHKNTVFERRQLPRDGQSLRTKSAAQIPELSPESLIVCTGSRIAEPDR